MFKRGVKLLNKRGQVTLFIIIAIVIVAAVVLFFVFRGSIGFVQVPASLQPAYNNFVNCAEQDTETGINVLASQGGYIELPEFEPGSEHMPFSSQLNFLGSRIPYWYYVSGNNIPNEQIPSKLEMESQLENFLAESINDCDFSSYYEQGFDVSWENVDADAKIENNKVGVVLNLDLSLSRGNESVLVRRINVEVVSALGELYDSARTVYETQQENLFLEEYAVDTLRSYAPVDGVEISCSPKIWSADEVFDSLQEGIEANTLALGSGIDSEGYFEIPVLGGIPSSHEVRFLNSRNWPNAFQVSPSDGSLLVASPAGNQAGLGIVGFCYVPYHFVYDMKYPVLVQIQEQPGEEIFQFPMAVIIQGNNPRESLNVEAEQNAVPELCAYKNTEITVNVRDKRGTPVDGAFVSYECFGNKCDIGQSSNGALNENFPQCANGFVVAQAEGFKQARYLFSTINPGSVDVILERLYEKRVQLMVDGVPYSGEAIINFIPEGTGSTQVAAYPGQTTVQLAEGQYEVQVYVYRNSSISIGATTSEQCITVPRGVFLGALGFTQERCFEIEIPSQVISQALSGGGSQQHFILESELAGNNVIEINAESLPEVETIEQLQVNHLLFEDNGLEINFR